MAATPPDQPFNVQPAEYQYAPNYYPGYQPVGYNPYQFQNPSYWYGQ
jgi:hypothetical protein